MAELGSGYADVPEAPRHVDIVRHFGTSNDRFDLPFAAASQITQGTYPIKMRAQTGSVHDFRIGARFRDGSIRYSAQATLFYFRPRG